MKAQHSHTQREQADIKRLMQNFDPQASKEAKPDVRAELQWRKEKLLALERIQHRNRQRQRGMER